MFIGEISKGEVTANFKKATKQSILAGFKNLRSNVLTSCDGDFHRAVEIIARSYTGGAYQMPVSTSRLISQVMSKNKKAGVILKIASWLPAKFLEHSNGESIGDQKDFVTFKKEAMDFIDNVGTIEEAKDWIDNVLLPRFNGYFYHAVRSLATELTGLDNVWDIKDSEIVAKAYAKNPVMGYALTNAEPLESKPSATPA